MKPQSKRVLIWSVAFMTLLISCGIEGQSRAGQRYRKNHAENQTSVIKTIDTENKNLTSNQAPEVPSKVDVRQNQNQYQMGYNDYMPPDPVLSNLPYYCDPRGYPPNIINNARVCDRFQPIPYLGYGQGPYNRVGPIVYPLRYGVGRLEKDFDDDDDHSHGYERWRDYHRP